MGGYGITPADGGGSTGLLWGDEAGGDQSRFEPRLLSPARFPDLENSTRIAVGTDAPEVLPEGQGAGLLEVEAARGKATWRRRLSPRHRDAVRQFFKGE